MKKLFVFILLLNMLQSKAAEWDFFGSDEEDKRSYEAMLKAAENNDVKSFQEVLNKASWSAKYLGLRMNVEGFYDLNRDDILKRLKVAKFFIENYGKNLYLEKIDEQVESPLRQLIFEATFNQDINLNNEFLSAIKLFAQHKANVNQEDLRRGLFSILNGIGYNNPIIFELIPIIASTLNDKNATNRKFTDVSINDDTPLTYIAKLVPTYKKQPKTDKLRKQREKSALNFKKVIKLLLELGFDPEAKNDKGQLFYDFLTNPVVKQAWDEFLESPEGQKRRTAFCKEVEESTPFAHEITDVVAQYCGVVPEKAGR